MDTTTAEILIRLNQQFYQTFAGQFSATRQCLQPGVRKVIQKTPPNCKILDLGCGNGKVWQVLLEQGFQGEYVGLDFSEELLKVARKDVRQTIAKHSAVTKPKFIPADLSKKGWAALCPNQSYDFIFAFAVLHHLPGHPIVTQLLQEARRLLMPGGRFILSVWQFMNSPRLRKRVQEWATIGLAENRLEIGDYLLDWRQGGHGFRYVHQFSCNELERLANECGFRIENEYLSDGKGGNLSLYQVWMIV